MRHRCPNPYLTQDVNLESGSTHRFGFNLITITVHFCFLQAIPTNTAQHRNEQHGQVEQIWVYIYYIFQYWAIYIHMHGFLVPWHRFNANFSDHRCRWSACSCNQRIKCAAQLNVLWVSHTWSSSSSSSSKTLAANSEPSASYTAMTLPKVPSPSLPARKYLTKAGKGITNNG